MRAIVCALALTATLVAAANPSPPVFPLSWSATEFIEVYETNGGRDTVNQVSSWQLDAQYNRTAQQVVGTSGPTTVAVVSDFVAQTDYYIQGDLCQYTCTDTTEACDGQDSLCDYDYVTSAKFTKTTTFQGQAVNEYQWMEGIGPIPMNALTLLVDAATNSVPVFQYRDLEPFGTYEGYINMTVTDYQPTTPPASAFNVPGLNLCPSGDGDQCPDAGATRAQRRLHQLRWMSRTAAAMAEKRQWAADAKSVGL